MRLGSAVPFTPSAARRLKRDLGELVEPLLKVCQADAQALARIPKGIDFSEVRRQLANVSTVAKNSSFDSPLTGDDIMRIANIGPGPKIAKFKRVLSDAVVEGRIEADDAQGAEDLLRNFLKLDTEQ